MFLITGLGNPGTKYANSRHNIGFEMINSIAAKHDIKVKKVAHRALIGDGTIAGKRVILAKPQTFMNLSGESVRAIMDYYKIPLENVLIIYDDAALDFAQIRIRTQGSSGGHNGMSNIIQHLGTDEIPRIRIGIGTPPLNLPLEHYVLQDFSKKETEELIKLAITMPKIIEKILTDGFLEAMNDYN